jgi:hypothetical protein
MTQSNEARRQAAAAAAEALPCIVCNTPNIERVGVYEPPDDDLAFREAADARMKQCYAYAICAECAQLDDQREQVYQALLAKWGRRSDD